MIRPRRALAAWAAALLVALALPAAAAAQCPRTSVADLEDEVMCPVCGTPLGLAQDPPQAKRQREFILRRVERCQSKDRIKAALVEEFGPEVLALPEDEGFDLAAYLIPALALVAGGAGIALALSRWRRGRRTGAGGPEAAAGPEAPSGALERSDARRLESDLERYRL